MRIGIAGFGRMGKLIREIALERGHSVPSIIDPQPAELPDDASIFNQVTGESLRDLDAVIDFSLPHGVMDNIQHYIETRVPAVIGTTGWENQQASIARQVQSGGASLLHGSNFSVGANLFFIMTQHLSKLINGFPQYDILLHEFHHKRKQDSPSGTAITAGNHIIENLPRKTSMQHQTLKRQIMPEELHVTATRGGDIPGLHMVLADSPEDTIELRHTARNRRGFALGAVLSAEWLQGKTGYYTFQDFFQETLAQ